MNYKLRDTCRLCEKPGLTRVLTLPDTPLANEYVKPPRAQELYPMSLFQCGSCGHVQLPTDVDPRMLFSEYSYLSGTAASFRTHMWDLAVELYRNGHRTMVDIGSNDGTLISAARNVGMRALGIDPACNLAALASAKCCVTIPAFFTPDLAKEVRSILGRPPDVVTALNVMAHCNDMGAFADAVREIIGETGTFIFEVAYLLDVLMKNEVGSAYAEHVCHHHVTPLVQFFDRHGLVLQDVHHVPTQGGSIRGYVGTDRNKVSPSIRLALAEERERIPELLASWQSRVDAEREATLAELRPYLGQGLAIYGAPARLTTYAYMLGLKPTDVMCVFDDNPLKVGRYTPGLHWSIVKSDSLPAVNPQAVLIAAWPYADAIKAKFPHYKGQWILPRRSA